MTYIVGVFTALQVSAIAKGALFLYCGYHYYGEYIPVPASTDLVIQRFTLLLYGAILYEIPNYLLTTFIT